MHLRQPVYRDRSLIWRVLTNLVVVVAILTGCGDQSQKALRLAAEAQQDLETGQLRAARKAITEAIAVRDDLAELHLLRGRIEYTAGSFANAFDAYSDALALDATNMEALQGVSHLGLQTGNLWASREATERILALNPRQPDALLVRGLQAILRRRYDEALDNANQILATDPASESGVILKARALSLSGKMDEALAIVNDPSLGGKQTVALATTRLEIHRAMRAAQPMAGQFAVLRRLRPDDQDLRIDEANFRYKTGEPATAMNLLVGVLASPKLTRADARNAAAVWQEYDSNGPGDGQLATILRSAAPSTREELAQVYLAKRDPGRAVRVLKGLDTVKAQGLIARAHLLAGRTDEARRLAEEILSRDETQCDALVARTGVALLDRDASAAVLASQQAAAECPDNIDAWLAVVAAYDAKKQPAGAERAFRDGRSANPQDLRLARSHAAWLLGHKQPRQALAAARRLVRSAPALVGGWRFLDELCTRLGDSCREDAAAGLEAARTRYYIDQRHDELPNIGLFGRLVAS